MRKHNTRPGRLLLGAISVSAGLALTLTGCSGNADTGTAGTPDGAIGVSLIVKTNSNPFFIAMQDGAKAAAEKDGVSLTLAAGKEDGDEDTQIQAIEAAISKGDQGILITPNGPAVLDAIDKARQAGIYVIALDTAPDPADAVDITFATDNFLAGQYIGQWTAAKLDGAEAVIGLVDLFDDKSVSVDYNRDQGFLDGLGIPLGNDQVNGDEPSSGSYSGGKGGSYTIVGNEASQGAEDGGRRAMENLLAKNPDINVVYTINEPAAYGAYQALEAAGKSADGVLIVSVDGGCAGVGQVADGVIDATSQQYPVKMAELGVRAIVDLVKDGTKPENSEGLDFFNTGVALVTDQAVGGVDSIDSAEASGICWGNK
ncbi:substrate-binding domain-containing protein [Microbacterium suwonense]|uniref:Sugar ABC transporter n=1 Tax=Microbacterium suwonense TaxID=683047 RepID=A0ABM8FPB7_9MICO|nr:substrate-binding domain-containing protein [Microbacterium suwonense]BDZ37528.1 sugar ABC transporter [Microbacterium suwonense]